LQAWFDDSGTGLNTADEIVSLLHMVLSVLTKCTGVPVKVKEVREQFKRILPSLLPVPWSEALERAGGDAEKAMVEQRFIGQIEMDQMAPSIREGYADLPIAGPIPDGALPPPPPDWATPSSLEKGIQKVKREPQAGDCKPLSKEDLAHLDYLIDDEDKDSRPQTATRAHRDETTHPPARGWMVIHGHEFASILKSPAAFRHLFMRSVATALAVPMGCIEIVHLTRGIVVEFLLHPSTRGNDSRTGEALKEILGVQLVNPQSTLRLGPLKDYCLSAELIERPLKGTGKGASKGASVATSLGASQAAQATMLPTHKRDQEIQTELQENEDMQEILRDLESTEESLRSWQQKAQQAEAERDAVFKELAALKAGS